MLLKYLIRFKFNTTRREVVERGISKKLKRYLDLCEEAGPGASLRVRVPRMPGVDEDMRNWSIYMILEHNTIVNRSMGNILRRLRAGEDLSPDERIDPKRDVMPGEAPGIEQVDLFRESVEDYLELVKPMDGLKDTATMTHPVFGEFTAHQWHCMFDFHLGIHLRQAEYILKTIKKGMIKP